MIKPTIGRAVWFWENAKAEDEQPEAAIVTYVWNDTMVNLCVFDASGTPRGRTSIFLHQEEAPAGASYCCEWMPYQKQQVARDEAISQGLAYTMPIG